jgi:hypothetical protein
LNNPMRALTWINHKASPSALGLSMETPLSARTNSSYSGDKADDDSDVVAAHTPVAAEVRAQKAPAAADTHRSADSREN